MTSIQEISNQIKTQDNRITDQPMFVVQKEVTDWGITKDHSDDYIWMNESNDYEEADEEKAEELESLDRDTPKEWEKAYFRKRWEFVTACFTESGCKDYLAINGHNLGKTRIFAYGSYRNDEYQTVRNMLIKAT